VTNETEHTALRRILKRELVHPSVFTPLGRLIVALPHPDTLKSELLVQMDRRRIGRPHSRNRSLHFALRACANNMFIKNRPSPCSR